MNDSNANNFWDNTDKTVDQVFEFVKNYKTPDNHIPFTTIENFRSYVENNSLECSKKSSALKFSDETIQYSLFSGLEYAVLRNKDVNWKETLQLIKHVISLPPRKNYITSLYDHMYAIYSLIMEGLKKDSIDFKLKDNVWIIIKKLVEIGTYDDSSKSPKEENDQESKCHLDNQNYSLDISLNDINGMSFHLVYQYAVWCVKHDNEMKIMPHEVKQVFDDYLDKKLGEYTIARHAVLGVFFPRFYHMDISLVKNILGKINTSENIWVSFWDGYMSGNTLVMYVFDDLYKLYDQFLNDENLIQNRKLKQPYYSTINHIMMAYLYNFNNVDHSVEKFLNKADKLTEQNGENKLSMKYCIEQLGEIIKDKNNDSKFNKEKLIKLWKRPSILQHDLNKWFENSPLDKKTTISLYLEYIKNYPKKFDLYFVSIDVLCLYVKDFPNEVLDCLEILVVKQANNIIPKKIKDVLKLLLNIDDSQIKTKCNRLTKKIEQLEYDWR